MLIRQPFMALISITLGLIFSQVANAEDVAFRRHVIADAKDSEYIAACVFDVNHDGKPDIVCGGYWYEAPTWKKHFLRTVETRGGGRPEGYAAQALDVNGDGWMDFLSVNYYSQSIRWIEHPGPGVDKDLEWKMHEIAKPGSAESGRLADILGDGTPCFLPALNNNIAWFELVRQPNPMGVATVQWLRHDVPNIQAGHGLGFGDVNGDGRGDIIGPKGWAEAPVDRRGGKWIYHQDFDLGQASVPILCVDVDGDGLSDIVWTRAHGYGVFWLKQIRDKSGKISWEKHVIDHTLTGAHAPLWADMDGDGRPELVLGRRYSAHDGADDGEYEPQASYRYQYDPKTASWRKHVIGYNDGVCFGVDPQIADVNGDGKLDIVVGGRSGLYYYENLGPGNGVARKETNDPLWFPRYTDHDNLKVVHDPGADADRPIRNTYDLALRRSHTIAALQDVLGELPSSHERVPLDMKIQEETKVNGYLRKKISYASDTTGRATAYLLVPEKTKKNMAGMICLPDSGKDGADELVRAGGREAMGVADDLAKKGYVCLVPLTPAILPRDKADVGYAGGAMRSIWDAIRGIDLLDEVMDIDAKRIGCIGHGQGGTLALLTAAFDFRVSAVVSSSGFTSIAHATKGIPEAWMRPEMMPRLRTAYQGDAAKVPFDFGEVLSTLFKRSAFVIAPQRDDMFDVEGVKMAVATVQTANQLKNANVSIQTSYPDGGHELTDASRAEAVAWLVQKIRP